MKPYWTPAALQDLSDIRNYIALDNDAAAQRIIQRIFEQVGILETMPGLGRPGRITSTRELVVSGTPYIVPYRVQEGRLEILRVLHAARKWPKRL